MRTTSIALASFLFLVAMHGVAHASWYYDWSCSGDCAPGVLAISGTEGPFESREACDAARDQDPRADYFVAEGNLGGLEFCEDRSGPGFVEGGYTPSTGSDSGGRPAAIARMQLGAIAGPGYRIEDPSGMTTSGVTVGFELGVQTGARPELGGQMTIGLQYTRVDAVAYADEPKPMTYVPVLFGLVSTPALSRGKTEIRLDVGVAVGAMFRLGCSDCAADGLPILSFAAEAHAGVDLYFQKTSGIGLDAVFLYDRQESSRDFAILPPAVLIRASLITRFHDGVVW